MQNVMRVFSVVLLIMVGTVFAVGPAGLIVELCSQSGDSGVFTSLLFWLVIILGDLLNSKTAEGATAYNTAVAYPVGILFAIAMLAIFVHATKKSTAQKA